MDITFLVGGPEFPYNANYVEFWAAVIKLWQVEKEFR